MNSNALERNHQLLSVPGGRGGVRAHAIEGGLHVSFWYPHW